MSAPSIHLSLLDCLSLAERLVLAQDLARDPELLRAHLQLQLRLLHLLRQLAPEHYLNRHQLQHDNLSRRLSGRLLELRCQ